MPRNLDSSLSAAISSGHIVPFVALALEFPSAELDVWSGVGDLAFGGKTFKGVGQFGRVSTIGEGTDVKADGLTVQLLNVPLWAVAGTSAPIIASPYQDANFNTSATNSCSVSLAVTAGELLIVMAYADGYAVGTPTVPTISGDSQSNTWTTDRTTTAAYIGGTGFGYLLGHATASATGTLTLTVGGPTGYGTGLLLVRTNALGIDATGLAAGSIGTQSLTPSASASAPEAALVLAAFDNAVWTSDEGTRVYTQGAGVSRNAGVWEFTGAEGTVSPTIGSGPSNFPVAAVVSFTNAPGTPVINITEQIQLGSAAKLWFGLLDPSTGAIIGAPYMIWRGLVDQPTVDVSAETFSVTLALESTMTNLSRATCRRYTAADQRLYYPDDTGFNFVEMLNDVANRWGS